MSELLHKNSKGIMMIREDFKIRSQVKVISGIDERKYCLHTYRFNFVHEPIEIPYCSWANLDCCGGWSFDEEYLDTAVQKGLKLFAGRAASLKHQYNPGAPTLEEAQRQFAAFKETLPNGVFADVNDEQIMPIYFYTFIYRAGTISDHIDLDMVFDFYDKLGYRISTAEEKEIRCLCGCEIKLFGTAQAPFQYAHAATTTDFITTGLLLGYPIESTVSILQGHR